MDLFWGWKDLRFANEFIFGVEKNFRFEKMLGFSTGFILRLKKIWGLKKFWGLVIDLFWGWKILEFTDF